ADRFSETTAFSIGVLELDPVLPQLCLDALFRSGHQRPVRIVVKEPHIFRCAVSTPTHVRILVFVPKGQNVFDIGGGVVVPARFSLPDGPAPVAAFLSTDDALATRY